jgi:hypothetical protein
MVVVRLEDILRNLESIESYILFRKIEDWCCDNLPRGQWRFSYSPALCVAGVDIPGRILFKSQHDATIFKLVFPGPGSID